MNNHNNTIVISAVNLVEGGTLTILRNCLDALATFNADNQYQIVVLVNNKAKFDYPHVDFIEFPKAKKSWLNRIYYEYFGFKKLSKKLKPYLWLSLHDMTPNVMAKYRAVYCHNATPFFKSRPIDAYFDYKVFLFTIFYRYLYQINIRKNDFIVVQQQWLRDAFARIYSLDKSKIVVAYSEKIKPECNIVSASISTNDSTVEFFYPSLPRYFKNFEIVCQAVKLLNEQGVIRFNVTLTIDGSENRYSQWLLKKYGTVSNIDFIGLVPPDKMPYFYQQTNCLIFASRLESWGLPISEFASYRRPMILADMPYAHETSNGVEMVDYFDINSAFALASKMKQVIDGDLSTFKKQNNASIAAPFVSSFNELLCLLTARN